MKINVLIFFMLCLASVSHAQVSEKKWGYFADASFGFIPASEGFNEINSVAAGATYLGQFGLGLAFSALTDDLKHINGVGLEARFTPARWLLLKVQGGAILNASDADNGTYSTTSLITYLPNESERYYWRTTAAIRFLRVLFVGVSTMGTGKQAFRYENSATTNPSYTTVKPSNIFVWQLGLSFPALPKRKKRPRVE